MPFAQATALLSVEREGVLDYRIIEISRDDPVIHLPIKAEWGPNVYVSLLAMRGRVREVPWQSFFSWGWKRPTEWYQAWSDQSAVPVPTATVDLAKPSYRLALAAIDVRTDENQLDVKVEADRGQYRVRDQAQITLKVTLPDGTPAAEGASALRRLMRPCLSFLPTQVGIR